jgi:antitoxin (DNA-binding transcriptional repressor) of toxin-antitoxin stability system
MTAITLEEAQTRLADLIHSMTPGEEFVITENDRPVATVIGHGQSFRKPRMPGSAKGTLVILADDDDHLADFKDYMP